MNTPSPALRTLSLRTSAVVVALVISCPEGRAQDADGVRSLKGLNLDDLANVEITSVSRVPERLLDAASAVQVVTSQDIQNSTATSLAEALRLVDNLNIAQQDSHDWAISARGFDANLADKLLVLVDDRAVYTPLYAGVLWNVQDAMLEDVDRIEVISGPGGVQWGANAMNGVINVTTKSAQDTQGTYVQEAGGGADLHDQTEVRYGGMLAPGVYYRVYGQYADRGAEPLADGTPNNDSWDMARGGFRIDAGDKLTKGWTIQGDIYDGSEFLGTVGDERMGGGNLLGRWWTQLSDQSTISLVAYVDRTHLSIPYAASPAAPPYYSGFPDSALVDDLNTYNVDLQQQIGSEKSNQFVWGASYRYTRETDTDQNLIQFEPTRLAQNLYTGFAEDRLAVTNAIHLSAGTKVEHNAYTGFEIEPSLRLAWDPAPNQLLWAAVSRAVRTPARYDRDLVLPTGLVNAPPPYQFPVNYLTGSPTFRSETLVAYELGYRAQLSPEASISVSTYYNSYNHLRSEAATATTATYPFPYPVVFENGVEAETAGVEASGDVKLTESWKLHAGYDLTHENVHAASGYVDATGAANETADPKAQLFLRSGVDLTSNLNLSVAVRWIDKLTIAEGPTSGPVTAIVPAYWEADLHLGWQATTHLELSLDGQNLLHNRHLEYGFPGPTAAYIQRTFYGKVEWRY